VLRIYTASFSSNGRKAVALARQLQIAHELIEVNVYRGEGRNADFLALNPFGKVPTLVDGDFVLWESNAILIYLSEAHGDFRAWAREPRRRAELARWLFWESAHWQPVLTQVLREHAGHIMAPAYVQAPSAEPRWDAPQLTALLQHLEQRLQQTPFLGGDELTLADFSVIAMTIYFRRLGFPFASYPALGAWYERTHALPGWKSTSAEPWIT
jgi:glutathione S-transferase